MLTSLPTIEECAGGELTGLDDDYDIAVLNLIAAYGLPGTQNIDVSHFLEKLDRWADQVSTEVWRHVYRFDASSHQPPTEFSHGNSLGRFICWFMLQVLQEDCGVVYNPEKKFKPDFCEPQDLFIHGILDDNGMGGTCASMPVVYVAVGRRLGLPVYLVETRGHLFFRWEDPTGTLMKWRGMTQPFWVPPDRFNVEGSGEGIAYRPDSHYIQWPELWQETDFAHGRYLASLSPRDALASFLVQRAECFCDRGNYHECLKAIYYARQLCPEDVRYEWLHAKRTRQYEKHCERMLEMEQEQRQRELALPGMPGHAPTCECGACRIAREEAKSRPVAPSDHGPSCQCGDCCVAREPNASSAGMPGHGEHCQCSGCLMARLQAEQSKPATGIPFPQPQQHLSQQQPNAARSLPGGVAGSRALRPRKT